MPFLFHKLQRYSKIQDTLLFFVICINICLKKCIYMPRDKTVDILNSLLAWSLKEQGLAVLKYHIEFNGFFFPPYQDYFISLM